MVPNQKAESGVRLGFVGLGAMGSRMAIRLLSAGHPLTVFNRTREKAEPLARRGARVALSPREVAEGCDIVFSSLADDAALEDVMRGPDGLLAGVRSGALLVDTSTVYPGTSRGIAEEARRRGASMLDAPVSGTTIHVEQGSLMIFVGGDKRDLDRATPYLRLLGNEIIHMGGNGMGLCMKLVSNSLLGLGLQALVEAIALGIRSGIDKERLLDALSKSTVVAPGHKPKLENARLNRYPPAFSIRLMHKDFGLIMRQATALSVPMPATAVAQQICAAERQKELEEDYSAVIRLVTELAGIGAGGQGAP